MKNEIVEYATIFTTIDDRALRGKLVSIHETYSDEEPTYYIFQDQNKKRHWCIREGNRYKEPKNPSPTAKYFQFTDGVKIHDQTVYGFTARSCDILPGRIVYIFKDRNGVPHHILKALNGEHFLCHYYEFDDLGFIEYIHPSF